MWCEGSLFWNAVSPITCPHTRGDGCGTWHDLPALVFLVFRLWPTRKRTPTCGVDARGTAPVALTPPIRAISILPFTIITRDFKIQILRSTDYGREVFGDWDETHVLTSFHRRKLTTVCSRRSFRSQRKLGTQAKKVRKNSFILLD